MMVAEPETCKVATFVGQRHLLRWPDPVSTEVGYSPQGLSDLLLSIVSFEKWEGSVKGVHLPLPGCPRTWRRSVPGVLWVRYAICVSYSTIAVCGVYRDLFYVVL